MGSNAPIGVFDSGMGGISVVRQIHKDMPNEDIIFFGDSANAPYGTRPAGEVEELSFSAADHLIAKGAKAIVIACNTATSAGAGDMRHTYDIPVIGMEPAVKVACDRGGGSPQNILVLATELTLKGQKFADLTAQVRGKSTIHTQPCPDLVTIVESGQLNDRVQAQAAISGYLAPFDVETLDSIVLGCTHFVFYRNYFEETLPRHVAVIDGNPGTSHHLGTVLRKLGIQSDRPESYTGTVTLENSRKDKATGLLAESLLHGDIPR